MKCTVNLQLSAAGLGHSTRKQHHRNHGQLIKRQRIKSNYNAKFTVVVSLMEDVDNGTDTFISRNAANHINGSPNVSVQL